MYKLGDIVKFKESEMRYISKRNLPKNDFMIITNCDIPGKSLFVEIYFQQFMKTEWVPFHWLEVVESV